MNRYLILAIPVVIGIISGYVVTVAAWQQEPSGVTASMMLKDGSPVAGDSDAPITVLEWGDYQCTFCFRFHESGMRQLEDEYINTGRIKFVFKDFPLNGPASVLAAEASYCADDQGLYWEYHDELYGNWAGERTGWITAQSLEGFAQSVGLDIDEFGKCMDEEIHRQRVLDLESFGRQIGVDATPSFFVFDDEQVIKIRGNQPIEAFRQAIDELER